MFVRKVKKSNGAISVRVLEGIRQGERVLHKTIKIVGQSKFQREIAAYERLAREIIALDKKKKEALNSRSVPRRVPIPSHVKLADAQIRSQVNDGIFDIFGKVYDQIGLASVTKYGRKNSEWGDIFKAMVIGRIATPSSKRNTARVLSRDYMIDYPLHKLYRTMDRIINFEDKIKQVIVDKSNEINGGEITIVLFDVTTLYFESVVQDDLKNFGFSKDCKFKEVQVVLSLITTESGDPVGYKLFPGNTSEGNTLIEHIEDVKKTMSLEKVTLIADRAMFTEKNLKKMESRGISYIVACKLRMLPKDMKESLLSDDYRACVANNEFCWIKSYEYKKRRLVVSYSSVRAKKDCKMRDRLVERIYKKAKDGKVKSGDVLGNNGSKKFLNLVGKTLEIDKSKIGRDAQWDGLHGVISSDMDSAPEKLLSSYRLLWKIENAFRVNKHELKMRPMYPWTPERIKSHILICYTSFAVSHFTVLAINSVRKSQGRSDMSIAACVDELVQVKSAIVENVRNNEDGNLYVLPQTLTPEQEDIYSALEVERPEGPFCA